MEHGLKDVAIYVQKHIAPWVIGYNPPLIRDMPLGVPAFVSVVFSFTTVGCGSDLHE